MTVHPADKTDILVSHKAIAIFLGLTPRQVSWWDEQGVLPTFKVGRSVCARKSKLLQWLDDREKEQQEAKKKAV